MAAAAEDSGDKLAQQSLSDAGVAQPSAKAMFLFHYVVSVIANGIVCGGAILLWSTLGISDKAFKTLEDYSAYAMPLMALAFAIFFMLYLLDFFWPPHLQNQILMLYDGDRCIGRIIFGVAVVLFIAACLLRSNMFQSLPLLISIILCPLAVFGAHMIYNPWKPHEEEEAVSKRKTEIVNSEDLQAKIGLLQRITGEEVNTHMFYKAIVAAFLTTFLWTIVLWIVGTLIKGTPLLEQVAGLTTKDQDKVYIQWAAPLVIAVSNLVFGLFSYFRVMVHQTYSRTNKYKNKILADFMRTALVEEMAEHRVEMLRRARHSSVERIEEGEELERKRQQYMQQDTVMAQNLSSIIKGCICVFIVLIGLGYGAVTLLSASTHIASMVTGTVVIFFVFFMILTYVSMQRILEFMGKWMVEMPAWQSITKLARHDLVKASMLCVFIPLMPGILLLSAVNQRIRKCRKLYLNYPLVGLGQGEANGEGGEEAAKPEPQTLCLTPRIQCKLEVLKSWDWISVVTMAYLLCGLYLVGYTISFPICNVALSAFRKALESANVSFAVILLAVFLIGVFCFLCPTVPGMLVYVFAGVLIADQCPPRGTEQGFWVGVLINFGLCWFLKLFACAIQQVCIGGMLSKSLWVRQTVGVHTTLIRCFEVVMRKKGLSAGKLAILCSGPDWPTSVLAGIMHLSLLECEVGTLPIIFFIIPCALTGSFYLKSSDPTSMLSSASSLMALASLIVTGVLWAISAWAVQQALEEHSEEVTRPLVENVHLEWLDYRLEYVRKKLKTTWSSIPSGVRLVWTFGLLAQIFVCHCFQWLFTSLVGKFAVSDSIDTLTFIAGFNADDGLFTYQSLALIGVYTFAWSGHVVYCIWKRRALGPERLAALKECDEMEAKWKEEYIKMCKLKAPTDAGAAGDAKVADSREAEVDAEDEVVGGYSVHV